MPTRRAFLIGALSAGALAACSKAQKHLSAATSTTTAAGSATPTTAAGNPTGAPAAYVPHGIRDQSRVALTFHGSGDPALTTQMLDLAARHAAPLTVFAVGTWLEQHPDIAGQILLGGHELANHTYTHPALGSLGEAAVATEISRCRDVLLRQTHTNGHWFRPSGIESEPSAMILAEAGKAGYTTSVGFDVDPMDYTDPGPDAIVARISARVQGGSIVSLHLGHAGTVAAFERILSLIQSRGLKPALVRDVLAA